MPDRRSPSRQPSPERRQRAVGTNRAVRAQKARHAARRSGLETAADRLTRVASSGYFLAGHVVWFGAWILWNTGVVPGIAPIDPFPFGLLTMIVSLEAIFLSIWILISQNQMTRQADRRAHLDLQVNLLAEQESTATLRAVHGIAQHLGVDPAMYLTDASLAEETDIEHLASRMDEAMPDPPGTSAVNPPRPGGMTPA